MAYSNSKYHRFRLSVGLCYMVIFIFQACGVKKAIPTNKYLLKKNHISVPRKSVSTGELYSQIMHQPNKRVLFNKLPVFLWAYTLGTNEKHPTLSDSVAWRRKLRNKLGEAPVFFDSSMAKLSADNIYYYLFNSGYFDVAVNYSVSNGNRKARVNYHVNPGNAYKLNSFFREPADTAIKSLLDSLVNQNPAYRLWWPINLNQLNKAKEGLAKDIRDRGYYLASPELLRYEIDTLFDKKEGAVFLKLDNPQNQTQMKRFRFGAVHLKIICSDDFLENKFPQSYDRNGNHWQMNHFPLHLDVLNNIILIDSGNWFSQSITSKTYVGLVEMSLFSYVDLFQEIDTTSGLIITHITAKAIPQIYFQAEPQGLYSPQGSSGTNFQTQSQRSFGMAGILSFNNRNVFGHGENFKLSSITSYEAIFQKTDFGNFAYGLQQSFNSTLSLPNFQLLDKLKTKNDYQRKNTVFSLSYQLESNPNFKRSSMPASVSLQFIKPNFSWYYTPVELSFNRNDINPSFLPKLPKLDQDFVKRVFTDQIITAAKIGGFYTNNKTKTGETYFFGRVGFETSGNIHRLARYFFQKNYNPDSSYKFMGVNYFQYSKIEGEIRVRRKIDNLNTLAIRANFGMAVPYFNSHIIPYDKRYFIGGSNSLRGWKPRGIGPGNTPKGSVSLIDRSGDFLLEANIEYRFTLIKNFIESALFMDAGNIWNLNKSGSATGYGVLNAKTFLSEVAVNTGIGFRLDLSLFLFRIDLGLPIRNPSKSLENRWAMTSGSSGNFKNYMKTESAVCIGIGYPF